MPQHRMAKSSLTPWIEFLRRTTVLGLEPGQRAGCHEPHRQHDRDRRRAVGAPDLRRYGGREVLLEHASAGRSVGGLRTSIARIVTRLLWRVLTFRLEK